MDRQTKEDKIREMLNKQSLIIGVAPITKSHIKLVEKNMLENGALSNSHNRDENRQRTIKSILKSWAAKNLKITDSEWTSIQIDEIIQTYSEELDILFLKCRTSADTTKITSHACNLPQDSNGTDPRLVQFIDKRAKAQYRAFQVVAKTLREEATIKGQKIQTNLRTGRTDFLLRIWQLGDQTPWAELPPIHIEQKIPNFEIGLFKDIYNLGNSSSSSSSSSEDDENQTVIHTPKEQSEQTHDQKQADTDDEDATIHPTGRMETQDHPDCQTSSDDESHKTPKPQRPAHKKPMKTTPTSTTQSHKTLVPETPATRNQDQSYSETPQKVTESPEQKKNKQKQLNGPSHG